MQTIIPGDADASPTLRVATPSDIPALEALIAESARALSVGFYTPEQVDAAVRVIFGVDSALVADGTYFLLEEQGSPVACGGWSRHRSLAGGDRYKGAHDALLDPGREAARIRAFFVHPGWARRGLARRLYEACRDAALAAGFRRLELMATLPGVPLYGALGFEAHETVELPMDRGLVLPCIRMSRVIGDGG